MKNARSVAVTAALLLALTGCAGTAQSAGDQRTAPETPSATPVESEAPLAAETPSAPAVDDKDAAFVAAVRAALPANTQIPNATDQQLIDAGHQACERRAAGESSDTMSVIEGETPNGLGYFEDSGVIISAARDVLCPVG